MLVIAVYGNCFPCHKVQLQMVNGIYESLRETSNYIQIQLIKFIRFQRKRIIVPEELRRNFHKVVFFLPYFNNLLILQQKPNSFS